MTGFLFGALIGGTVGLAIGWVALPEPVWFRDWWIKHGWAHRK